ncbi:MAG TPA: DNA-formamidopyrimidine glycosylase [Firmicutes bacterium]|jgi:formamidopyrimidine-DNA glycosylase|nr:DNA-formamidopyrimidine glycosylase [Bacillota bacterium]HBL67505.1 DNA-formamidopyrimidine glycosylase [Bacillota bacterium]
MPELPEVETIKRGLEPHLIGRTIIDVRFFWDNTAQGMSPVEMTAKLRGQKIRGLDRKGKFLVLRFESGSGLGVHLRMTGKLIVCDPAEDPSNDKCARAVLLLDNGSRVLFSDVRKFGRFYWIERGEHPFWQRLGPDALYELTPEYFRKMVRQRKRIIKAILLDQSLIAGVGNIYADESLHRACISPSTKGSDLTEAQADRLYQVLKEVLNESIACKGTSYRDYVDGLGKPGSFQEKLAVYGQKGQACKKCGAEICRTVVANRGTYYCPHCQPDPQ